MRKTIYQAALLHDIGKFIERARLPEWRKKAEKYLREEVASPEYAHRRYSAAFIEELAAEKPFLQREAANFALLHHRGTVPGRLDARPWHEQSVELNLIRIADDCASSERREKEELTPLDYRRARVLSPFAHVRLRRNGELIPAYIPLRKLDISRECAFPELEVPEEPIPVYEPLVSAFLEEVRKIDNDEALFYLMEKYLHAVPAQTPVDIQGQLRPYAPDINLFDHSRTVAAIALGLYDAWIQGPWRGQDEAIRHRRWETLKAPLLLVSGDVSGIQDFIFSIPSKGAARSLKGRSFFIQLYTDTVVQYLRDQLELEAASVLYSGGGNFLLLVSAHRASDLESIRAELEGYLLQQGFYLGLAWVPVHITDFKQGGFSARWQAAHQAVERQKRRRFQQRSIEEVFTPFAQTHRNHDPFADLTRQLVNAQGYAFQPPGKQPPNWEEAIYRLGYHVFFTGTPHADALVFNDTDFAGRWRGFRFAVKDLPRYRDLDTISGSASPEAILDFDHLATLAAERTGTDKLAVLKMDVDNLGQLFARGLPEDLRSIARVAALSRALKWFFEGYMNTLLKEDTFSWLDADGNHRKTPFWPHIYPIFSGGDDFFVVGSWDAIFAFALKVQEAFTEFVANPDVTLSASLLIIDPRFPVSRFAELAEERLEAAKHAYKAKNAINVFNRVLSWKAFDEAYQRQEELVRLIREGESRSLLQRIRHMALDMERILEEARRGRLHMPKVWRIHYYLTRNLKDQKNEKKHRDYIEQLIADFEAMACQALTQPEKSPHPSVLAVAARWAELTTRTTQNQYQKS